MPIADANVYTGSSVLDFPLSLYRWAINHKLTNIKILAVFLLQKKAT